MAQLLYLKDVVTLVLEPDKCVGCGTCAVVCPHGVFALVDSKAAIKNRDACMECGACAANCPTEAVRVNAGVGCAAAVINSALGRSDTACCCVIDNKTTCC
jgi:ferredoxin